MHHYICPSPWHMSQDTPWHMSHAPWHMSHAPWHMSHAPWHMYQPQPGPFVPLSPL